MNKTVARSDAICAVILICAAILIVLIYPVRVFKEHYITDTGMASAGADYSVSEPVTRDATLVQRFTTQYDRVDALDVYVEEVTLGRSIELDVYDKDLQPVLTRYYDLQNETVPGPVRLPIGLDVEPAEEYVLLFRGLFSTVRYGLVPETETDLYLGSTAYKDTGLEHVRMAVSVIYELPLGKKKSFLWMGITALIAILAVAVTRIRFQRSPLPFMKKNAAPVGTLVTDPPVTVRRVLQVVLNPLICAGFGLLFVLNWPLKTFDDRPLDVVFYGVGILIAWGTILYMINVAGNMTTGTGAMSYPAGAGHDIAPVPLSCSNIRSLLQSLSVAAMLWYSTDYMNGLYDIEHRVSERHITIAFLALMLLTFPWKEWIRIPSVLTLLGSAAVALAYVNTHRLPPEDRDFLLGNQVVRLTGICIVLSVCLIYHLIRTLYARRDSLKRIRISLFGAATILLGILLIVFRNGRLWGIALIGFYGVFYLRIVVSEDKEQWNGVLLRGLLLNLVLTVCYCLLYRYYAAFITSRFAMRFHTVTVTAEYLTVMCGAAIVLFLAQRRKVYNTTGGFVLTGVAAAYTIFTLSRTAYLAVMVMGILLLALDTPAFRERRMNRLIRNTGGLLLAVLLLFPAVFTLQRVLPVLVGHPVMYEIEHVDTNIRGAVNPDHRNLMSVGRFIGHFQNKILGMEEPGYNYPEDDYNYDENGERLYDLYGNPLTSADSGPRRSREEAQDGYEGSVEQFSNGRMEIFRAYIKEINLTGHEEMSALFPDGTPIIHAHNVYLQVIHDNGLITGVVFVLWLILGVCTAAVRFYKNADRDPYLLLPVAVLIGFMAAGLTEWNFQYANPMTIALLLSVAPVTVRTKESV